MIDRKKIVGELMQNMYAMRKNLMAGHVSKKMTAITPSQGFVLRFVAHNDSVNIKAVAEALHMSSSAATQLVDGLVEKGFLLRKTDPDDRRSIALSLSEKAKKQMTEFKRQHVQKMMDVLSALTDEELEQFMLLNQKILDFISKK